MCRCVYVYVCMCVCVYVCVHTYEYVSVYVCVWSCTLMYNWDIPSNLKWGKNIVRGRQTNSSSGLCRYSYMTLNPKPGHGHVGTSF